jgi:hypothetical protein
MIGGGGLKYKPDRRTTLKGFERRNTREATFKWAALAIAAALVTRQV